MLDEKSLELLKDDHNINYTKLHDDIYVYHGMLTKPFEYILSKIDMLESGDDKPITSWSIWGSSNSDDENRYIFGEQKRFDEKKCLEDVDYNEIYRVLSQPIILASYHYGLKHAIEIGSMTALSVSRYFEGKFMGSHTDSYELDDKPTISVVMYLNDDYEGGELYFREQDVTVKAKAGDIVIFPSKPPFFHESKAIISGTKYICPGFWNNL